MQNTSIFWFRRDLRLNDNTALFHALNESDTVYPVFIFDTTILEKLPSKNDRRIQLIWDTLSEIQSLLNASGKKITILHGNPAKLIPLLAESVHANTVYTNRDYEPAALKRDESVEKKLTASGIRFKTYKDHVIFEKDDILKSDGTPYVVYTPYSKAWHSKVVPKDYQHHESEKLLSKMASDYLSRSDAKSVRSLTDIGFNSVAVNIKGTREKGLDFLDDFLSRIDPYGENRDFPAAKGVSYLSPYLRFGQISIRECVRSVVSNQSEGAKKWLNELIWREFYSMILYKFPHAVSESFNPSYKNLNFSNNETYFKAWCAGKTGFPIVDAAMRQLNETGWMHNRLRMIAASFLVKDLHIDWRWGEKYFADLLLDFDLASNNGGWQWAASTGCDAQPYFRIFNPELQSKKFDPDGVFIRKYIPELKDMKTEFIHTPWATDQKTLFEAEKIMSYPKPIVDHQKQKETTLQLFKSVRDGVNHQKG